jgi:nucleotide-binding universal stress UspA family protein
MKTILVATDFSPAANNACLYAYELTKLFRATLIIYTAYQQIPIVLPDLPVLPTPEDMKAFVEQQLKQEAKRLNTDPSINVETISSEGPSAIGIMDAARESNADLIVTGMKGTGKGLRKLFGSTVTSLVNKTSVPLIIVPENKKYNIVNAIALANESDMAYDADTHLLDAIREVAEKFKSNLYLVRVAKDKMKQAFAILYSPSRIKRILRDLQPVYECIEGKEVTSALNGFIKEHKVDMLAMLSHPHSVLSKWLGGSATQNMLFEAEIPLLIIPLRNAMGNKKEILKKDFIL